MTIIQKIGWPGYGFTVGDDQTLAVGVAVSSTALWLPMGTIDAWWVITRRFQSAGSSV
jgi:hypothetical protein